MLFNVGTPSSPADWHPAPHAPPALGQDVHLWRLSLHCAAEPDFARLARLLSPDERHRADRFHRDLHRRRYVIGRASLRLILAGYVARDPRSLAFTYNRWGKPALGDERGPQFNLAHAEDLALVAVRCGGPVGVDVERVDLTFDPMTVAAEFLPSDVQAIARESDECRAEAFLNVWVRRSQVKGGRHRPVRTEAGVRVRRLRRIYDVHSFIPAAFYVAALAVSVPTPK